jgi:hypothetical protein
MIASCADSKITCLIPTLNGSRDGVQNDSQVQNLRVLPFVSNLLMNYTAIFVIELGNVINMARALRDQCTFDEVRFDILELVFVGECFDILQ